MSVFLASPFDILPIISFAFLRTISEAYKVLENLVEELEDDWTDTGNKEKLLEANKKIRKYKAALIVIKNRLNV